MKKTARTVKMVSFLIAIGFLFMAFIFRSEAMTSYLIDDELEQEFCRQRLLRFVEVAQFHLHFVGEGEDYPPSLESVYLYSKNRDALLCSLDSKPLRVKTEEEVDLRSSFSEFKNYRVLREAGIPEKDIVLYYANRNYFDGGRVVLFGNFILRWMKKSEFLAILDDLEEQAKLQKKGKWQNHFKAILKNAERGDVQAQYKLGQLYERDVLADPDGPEKTLEKAIIWWKKAADGGLSEAQYVLSDALRKSGNFEEFHYWLRKAADSGYPVAQYNLAVALSEGDHFKKDLKGALLYYRRSADQGYYGAQYNLGVMYKNGDGVKKDEIEAMKWFLLAARQGYPRASKPVYDLTHRYIEPVEEMKKILKPDQIEKAQSLANAVAHGREN